MKALRRGLVIVKFIKEATDSILYSEHPIKIGSHTSRGGGGGGGAPTKHHRYVCPRF